jgi:serine protease Do
MRSVSNPVIVRRRSHWLAWGLTAVLAAACVAAGLPASGASEPPALWREAPADTQPLLPTGYQPLPSLAGLVKQLRPAVVNIFTTQVVKPRLRGRRGMPQFRDPRMEEFFGGRDLFEYFHGPQQEFKRNALGTGFFISPDGYLLTNHHVVAEATEIKVRMEDERTLDAKIIGSDAKTDIALLKVSTDKDLPFAHLGDSDKMEVGDWAIAIGNPFGLGHTVTAGIISGMGRNIGQGPYDDFLQTDAAINPGNSGGPLFDSAGRVVGINTAIVAGGASVGFAVPINLAKQLLPQLRTSGKVTRGWLGIGIQDLTEELAAKFGVQPKSGVLVSQVFPGSPSEKAGLRAGDIVLSIDGKAMSSSHELTSRVAGIPPGKQVRLELLREGKRQKLSVVLGEREKGEALAMGQAPEADSEQQQAALGLSLTPLTPERARRLGLEEDLKGLLVQQVDPAGPTAGILRPQDVILEVNRRRVASLADFSRALGKTPKGSVLLRVQRGNSQVYVVIEG